MYGHKQEGAHSEHSLRERHESKPGLRHDQPFKSDSVRSLAGHSDKVTVKPYDTDRRGHRQRGRAFIKKGWGPTAGDYSLSLPRVSDNELDPSATFGGPRLVEGDVLVLINRKPQVDGADASPRLVAPWLCTRLSWRTSWMRRSSGARLRLCDLAGDLRRVGSDILMTLAREDGAGTSARRFAIRLRAVRRGPRRRLRRDPRGRQWIPGFGLGIHPSLGVPFVCVSGTRGYYAHESHFAERWDSHRYSMRLDSLLESLLRRQASMCKTHSTPPAPRPRCRSRPTPW